MVGTRRAFNRCVKSVKKTVRARKGSSKKSAAIAICTKSVLQKRGRTMKSYSRKRLLTQKKFRGGLLGDKKSSMSGLFSKGLDPMYVRNAPMTPGTFAKGNAFTATQVQKDNVAAEKKRYASRLEDWKKRRAAEKERYTPILLDELMMEPGEEWDNEFKNDMSLHLDVWEESNPKPASGGRSRRR